MSHNLSSLKVGRLSKRSLLKAGGAAILAAPFVSRAWAKTIELTMLGWYGIAEPDMVGVFEEANNVKFVPKYYQGGDNMLAELENNPPGTFDIVHVDGEYGGRLIEKNLVMELDPNDYPMDDLLHDSLGSFPGHWGADGKLYSLVARFGHDGVAYNKDAVSEKQASTYEAYWEPKLKGRIGHFQWHLTSLAQISLLNGNVDPFDLDEGAWTALREKTLSLRSQIRGFFNYKETLSGLMKGELSAVCGIGDWLTAVLERKGSPVTSLVPAEGAVQWTESYSIVKTSTKKEMALKYLAYTMSPEGQAKTAQMKAYPGHCVTKSGRKLLSEIDPVEADRSGQVNGHKKDPIKVISEGRTHHRKRPLQQGMKEWGAFWSEYKNS